MSQSGSHRWACDSVTADRVDASKAKKKSTLKSAVFALSLSPLSFTRFCVVLCFFLLFCSSSLALRSLPFPFLSLSHPRPSLLPPPLSPCSGHRGHLSLQRSLLHLFSLYSSPPFHFPLQRCDLLPLHYTQHIMASPSPLPRNASPLPHSHDRDDVQGVDIIQATLKPTKWDHFKALVAHNTMISARNPSVYIFGAVIPLLMIGIAIGIVSLSPASCSILLCFGPLQGSRTRGRLDLPTKSPFLEQTHTGITTINTHAFLF